jgi:hypothetical protein
MAGRGSQTAHAAWAAKDQGRLLPLFNTAASGALPGGGISPASRAERKTQAPITCNVHGREEACLEPKAYNPLTTKALPQLGSIGTGLAKENRLHQPRSARMKSPNNKTTAI